MALHKHCCALINFISLLQGKKPKKHCYSNKYSAIELWNIFSFNILALIVLHIQIFSQ